MFLLPYRFTRHKTICVTPTELYFARDLRLSLDLLQGKLLEKKDSYGSYVSRLREKLEQIHNSVMERMN